MNLFFTGSLIHDSEPITSLLILISGNDKHIESGTAAKNCFVCVNNLVMTEKVSFDEKNEGSIKFNIFFTIAAGFQT